MSIGHLFNQVGKKHMTPLIKMAYGFLISRTFNDNQCYYYIPTHQTHPPTYLPIYLSITNVMTTYLPTHASTYILTTTYLPTHLGATTMKEATRCVTTI
jgi:hypothetical protein